jgi:queuosine precursor transporter
MVNELILLIFIVATIGALTIALRMGKGTLIAFTVLAWVLANLFITKQLVLFGFTATASDALAVGATLCLNVIQEYYGKAAARQTIQTTFFCLIFYTLATALQVTYQPAPSDTSHTCFVKLLAPMPRLTIASLVTYLISQYLEYYLYGFLQYALKGRHFIFRNYSSVTITQLVDTILFTFLGLYGTMEQLYHVVIISYSIKLATIAATVPLLQVFRQFVRAPSEPS